MRTINFKRIAAVCSASAIVGIGMFTAPPAMAAEADSPPPASGAVSTIEEPVPVETTTPAAEDSNAIYFTIHITYLNADSGEYLQVFDKTAKENSTVDSSFFPAYDNMSGDKFEFDDTFQSFTVTKDIDVTRKVANLTERWRKSSGYYDKLDKCGEIAQAFPDKGSLPQYCVDEFNFEPMVVQPGDSSVTDTHQNNASEAVSNAESQATENVAAKETGLPNTGVNQLAETGSSANGALAAAAVSAIAGGAALIARRKMA